MESDTATVNPVAPVRVPVRSGCRWPTAIAVSVVLTAGAFLLGRFATGPAFPADESAEAGFARAMSVHHTQAVHMGMLAYRQAGDPRLHSLGYDIALSQQGQIGRMHRWLDEWGLTLTSNTSPMKWMDHHGDGGGSSTVRDGVMPGMATAAEIALLEQLRDREFDALFCQLMLRHHLGGLHMVDDILKLTELPDVRQLAGAMRTAQRNDIEGLRRMLTEWGAQVDIQAG